MGMKEEIDRTIELITWWITKIKAHNYLDFYDINRVAEDLAVKLLNEIYGLQLINLNEEKPNYPGIDLGDKINKIAFQVTSRSDPGKIQECLDSFVKDDKAIYSNGIRFLILNENKPKLTGKKWQGIYADFKPSEHIITHNDLILEIKKLYDPVDRARFERIKEILEEEVAVKGLKNGKGELKKKQIKILSITASPDDVNDIFYEREQDTLLNAFQHFDRDDVYLDMPDPVKSTLDEIKERLEDGKHDILHITAHGGINENGEGVLSFEDHRGQLETVTGSQLAEVLKGLTPAPIIVILSACHSARPEPGLMPVARVLFDAGITAVIGMDKAVSQAAAVEFNRAFFTTLFGKKTIKEAFEAGKEAILKDEQRRIKENPNWHALKNMIYRNY